jgi:hypothetical protein
MPPVTVSCMMTQVMMRTCAVHSMQRRGSSRSESVPSNLPRVVLPSSCLLSSLARRRREAKRYPGYQQHYFTVTSRAIRCQQKAGSKPAFHNYAILPMRLRARSAIFRTHGLGSRPPRLCSSFRTPHRTMERYETRARSVVRCDAILQRIPSVLASVQHSPAHVGIIRMCIHGTGTLDRPHRSAAVNWLAVMRIRHAYTALGPWTGRTAAPR